MSTRRTMPTAISLILAPLFLLACVDSSPGSDNNNGWFSASVPQSARMELDLLVVVDHSPSMGGEYSIWGPEYSFAFNWLRYLPGGFPDLHVGVISSDLGSGTFQLATCGDSGGDNGTMGVLDGQNLFESCVGTTGQYIVDIEAIGCDIEKEEDGVCLGHDCSQPNCDAAAQSGELLTLASSGCPRCQNYENYQLHAAFSCMAGFGVSGCSFSQPLEAMYLALSGHPQNDGFLRDDAYLVIVFVTDRDDCSAAAPELFNDSQDSIDSPLGYLTPYRCFEFGVTCDINDRSHIGQRQNCRPRDDADALLHPISRYVQHLREIKDPQQTFVAALAGPFGDGRVIVERDVEDRPKVQISCEHHWAENTGGQPGVRLKSFVDSFNSDDEMPEAFLSICEHSLEDTLSSFGVNVVEKIAASQCLPQPLWGCEDVGARFGFPADEETCNDECLPDCLVTDVFERGTVNELRSNVPPCLWIMPNGTVDSDNSTPSRAYRSGTPEIRDADLPVTACWYVSYQPDCSDSNSAQLLVSRRSDPPSRSFAEVICREFSPDEPGGPCSGSDGS